MIRVKYVTKANDRSSIIDLELNTQLQMRILDERARKEIFRCAIVEMGWSSNRSEMA